MSLKPSSIVSENPAWSGEGESSAERISVKVVRTEQDSESGEKIKHEEKARAGRSPPLLVAGSMVG
jgi:hypothetical protein